MQQLRIIAAVLLILTTVTGSARAQGADPATVELYQDWAAFNTALSHVQKALGAYMAKTQETEARLKWMLEDPAAAAWVPKAPVKPK